MKNESIHARFLRQPAYYKDFSCIGGDCPVSCCLVWRVDWTDDEVEKLKNAKCSDHLKELIDSSFTKPENSKKYAVKMDENNRCPFLTEDNFCSIQRELGEEYLSYTCRVYPRRSVFSGGVIYRCCNLSCYHVVDTLCKDKDCMKLENVLPNSSQRIKERAYRDKEIDLINYPELKYRSNLFEFFYGILYDESRSIEASVILGALAAQKISEFIGKGKADMIPDIIKALESQVGNKEQLASIENIRPNYKHKLPFLFELNKLIIKSNLFDNVLEDGKFYLPKYIEGENLFKKYIEENPFILRNIALNLWIEIKMPYRNDSMSLFENYGNYVAAIAAAKMIGACIFASGKDPVIGFKSALAYVSRSFSHNENNVKIIDALVKKYNGVSPAYLAVLIK